MKNLTAKIKPLIPLVTAGMCKITAGLIISAFWWLPVWYIAHLPLVLVILVSKYFAYNNPFSPEMAKITVFLSLILWAFFLVHYLGRVTADFNSKAFPHLLWVFKRTNLQEYLITYNGKLTLTFQKVLDQKTLKYILKVVAYILSVYLIVQNIYSKTILIESFTTGGFFVVTAFGLYLKLDNILKESKDLP